MDPKKPGAKKPQTVDEALKQLETLAEGQDAVANPTPTPTVREQLANAARGRDATTGKNEDEEEADDLLGAEAKHDQTAIEAAQEGEDKANEVPSWICFPDSPKWKIPPYKQLAFIRFRASWTDTPHLGDRVLILWSLSDNEEKLGSKRTRGDANRTLIEMSKGMIRAMGILPPEANGDNEYKNANPMTPADWTGTLGTGNVDRFWNEIGPKCRTMISNYYLRTHSLNTEETADFFLNCLSVRSAVVG